MFKEDENRDEKNITPNHRLRRAREQKGWTHKDVADQIGLPDPHTVGRWERGVSGTSSRYKRELCRIFGMTMEELGLLSSSPLTLVDSKSGHMENFDEPVYHTSGKLPTVLTSFLGREREVAELSTLLKDPQVRLVTLLGPGGVGKTRLSTQVAQELQGFFKDGAYFVPLAPIDDPALVIPTLAKVFNIEEGLVSAVAPSLIERVKTALRPRSLLLLFDNVEQVSVAAPLFEELLAACPGVKVLATSRSMLHVQAERIFAVQPLALPDPEASLEPDELLQYGAIALFVQRVQAVQHQFRLTPELAPLVVNICRRLDGLPLALELAAARANIFPLHSLSKKLASRFEILKSEQQSRPERHRTLQNTIKWSYDLLTEQEQRLFRWLSLFSGGYTLEAIEAICASRLSQDESFLDRLVALCHQSLLDQVASDQEDERYMMLETVREYGMQCLRECGELEQCQRAHAWYYLTFVEKAAPDLKGPRQAEWLGYLNGELTNLRLTLSWLIEQKETDMALRFVEGFGKFCGLSGYWTEELRWLKAVLALPSPEDTQALARVLRRAGHLAYRLRDLDTARHWYQESVDLSQKLNDQENLAGALLGLGWTLYRQKEVDEASAMLQMGVDVARRCGSEWSHANALESFGRFLFNQGQMEDARLLVDEGVQRARRLNDKESLARLLTTSIGIELAQGRLGQAQKLAEECMENAQALDTKPLRALALDNLAEVAMFQENYQSATALFQKRGDLARELGDMPSMVAKQLNLGEIALLKEKNSVCAEEYITDSLRFFREQSDNPNIAKSLYLYGEVKRLQKDFEQAINFYQKALHLEDDMGNKRHIARNLIGLAKAAAGQQRCELAALLGGSAELLTSHATLYPAQRAEYQDVMQKAAETLGQEAFVTAWARGRDLSLEEVFALLA